MLPLALQWATLLASLTAAATSLLVLYFVAARRGLEAKTTPAAAAPLPSVVQASSSAPPVEAPSPSPVQTTTPIKLPRPLLLVAEPSENVPPPQQQLPPPPPPPPPPQQQFASIPFRSIVPPSSSKKRGRGQLRQVESLVEKLAELKGASLSDALSFYLPEWTGELLSGDLQSRAADPKDNVAELLKRARAVYEATCSTCEFCSGVYIGKTSRFRMSERFGTHRKKAAGKPAAVLMVALGSFSIVDVPEALVPFGVGGEVLSLLYESLLTVAVRESGLPEFKDEALAGGGRIGSNEVGIVYMVLVVSNEAI